MVYILLLSASTIIIRISNIISHSYSFSFINADLSHQISWEILLISWPNFPFLPHANRTEGQVEAMINIHDQDAGMPRLIYICINFIKEDWVGI